MMKLTRAQIELIREHTPKELKGQFLRIETTLGHFQKAGANWTYKAGWTADGQLIVTAFDEVQ